MKTHRVRVPPNGAASTPSSSEDIFWVKEERQGNRLLALAPCFGPNVTHIRSYREDVSPPGIQSEAGKAVPSVFLAAKLGRNWRSKHCKVMFLFGRLGEASTVEGCGRRRGRVCWSEEQ